MKLLFPCSLPVKECKELVKQLEDRCILPFSTAYNKGFEA